MHLLSPGESHKLLPWSKRKKTQRRHAGDMAFPRLRMLHAQGHVGQSGSSFCKAVYSPLLLHATLCPDSNNKGPLPAAPPHSDVSLCLMERKDQWPGAKALPTSFHPRIFERASEENWYTGIHPISVASSSPLRTDKWGGGERPHRDARADQTQTSPLWLIPLPALSQLGSGDRSLIIHAVYNPENQEDTSRPNSPPESEYEWPPFKSPPWGLMKWLHQWCIWARGP